MSATATPAVATHLVQQLSPCVATSGCRHRLLPIVVVALRPPLSTLFSAASFVSCLQPSSAMPSSPYWRRATPCHTPPAPLPSFVFQCPACMAGCCCFPPGSPPLVANCPSLRPHPNKEEEVISHPPATYSLDGQPVSCPPPSCHSHAILNWCPLPPMPVGMVQAWVGQKLLNVTF